MRSSGAFEPARQAATAGGVNAVLTTHVCQCKLDAEVTASARKHGVEDADIQHAWTNAIRLVEYEYNGRNVCWPLDQTATVGCSSSWLSRWTSQPGHPRRPTPADVLRLPEMR